VALAALVHVGKVHLGSACAGDLGALCLELEHDALDAARPAHAWRRFTAELLGEAVVASAAAQRALRSDHGRVDLPDGARVVVEPAHQARIFLVADARRLEVVEKSRVVGAALVAGGRANDAIKVYGEALNDRPRRAASLLGLLRAQEAAGDKAGARVTRAELTKMWAHADPEVRAKLMAGAK